MTKKMTRKEALEKAIMCVEYSDFDMGEGDEICRVLRKMVAAIDKQAARPKTKSSARVQNETMAKEFISLLTTYCKPVNTKWICEHIRYCTTSQKAVHVAKVAEEWGAVERITVKGRTYYELVDNWKSSTF